MNRNRLIAIGLIAIVLAFGVTYVTFSTVSKKIASSQQPMSDVVVTTSDLSVGARIQPVDVKLAKVPTAQLPDGYFSVPADVVGRGVIVPMFKNEMVISAKLAGERAGDGAVQLTIAPIRDGRLPSLIRHFADEMPVEEVQPLDVEHRGVRHDAFDAELPCEFVTRHNRRLVVE